MVLAILRGMHPDIRRLDELVMSDTGSEKRRSIAFLQDFSAWMRDRFPTIPITVLSYADNRWLHYKPLHEYCLEEGHERLPSRRLRWCTDKAKIQPITHYLKRKYPKRKVTVLIGFESTEGCRVQRGRNRVPEFQNRFPLADLGMDRTACEDLIRSVGLWVPPKSACFMCPFMKTQEVREMAQEEPDRFDIMLRIERVVNERRRREGKSGFYFKHKPLTELVQRPQPGTQTLF